MFSEIYPNFMKMAWNWHLEYFLVSVATLQNGKLILKILETSFRKSGINNKNKIKFITFYNLEIYDVKK